MNVHLEDSNIAFSLRSSVRRDSLSVCTLLRRRAFMAIYRIIFNYWQPTFLLGGVGGVNFFEGRLLFGNLLRRGWSISVT